MGGMGGMGNGSSSSGHFSSGGRGPGAPQASLNRFAGASASLAWGTTSGAPALAALAAPGHAAAAGSGVSAVAASDGAYERSVIAALCAPAGLRAAPADEALAGAALSSPLNGPLYKPYLRVIANSPTRPWQVRPYLVFI